MRITNSILYRAVRQNINRASEDMYKYQEQLTSGKQISRPSDDPLGALRAQQIHTELSKIDQYGRNQTYAKSWLNSAESSLTQVNDLLVRLKEIVISQGSGNANSSTQEVAADEVQTIKDQLLSLANTKVGNRSIFAGHETNLSAFLRNNEYAGDDGKIYLNVDKDVSVQINLDGESVFAAGQYTNVFETIDDLVTALESHDQENILDSLDHLDEAFSNVRSGIAVVGSRSSQINNVKSIKEDQKIRLQEELGQVEEVDLIQSIIGLESAKTAFQAALASGQTLSNLNLSQFI